MNIKASFGFFCENIALEGYHLNVKHFDLCFEHVLHRIKCPLFEKTLWWLFAGIYFRIMGYGKCSWTEILGRDTVSGGNRAQNNERSLVKYSGNEEYLDTVVYIIGSKSGNDNVCIIYENQFAIALLRITVTHWSITMCGHEQRRSNHV